MPLGYAERVGFLLLLACWGSAAVVAREGMRRAGEARPSLIACLAVALVSVVPGQLCRLTASLPLAMGLAAVAFAAGAWWLRARGEQATIAPARDARPAWPAFVVGGLALACVVHGALFRNFFDEEHHVPMAMALVRGVAPPEHPLLPGQVLPYHWGVDAVYAQLVTAGLGIERAIDLVTIGSFALFVWVASTLGALAAGRVGATLMPMVVPLAGSALAQPLHDDLGPFALVSRYPAAWREWTRRPPPITADFFQHPQGLALPMVLAVLALVAVEPADDDERRRTLRRAVGAALLACLSLVQAVHFLVLGFGLVAAAVLVFARTRDRRRLGLDLGMLAVAALLAPALGGFFSPGAGTGSTLVWGLDFFRSTSLADSLAHHLIAFGLPLLLLPLALIAGGRLRLALVFGAVVGFALPNVVVYRHSWDIVKLYSAGGFLAGVALADTLARVWQTRRLAGRVLVVVLTLVAVEFPLAWLASRTVLQGRAGVPVKVDWRPRQELTALGVELRPLVPWRDLVLVHEADVARVTGLFAPGFDAKRYASGHIVDFARGRALMAAQARAFADMERASLDQLQVRWVLLSDGEQLHIGAAARQALADAERFEQVKSGLPGRFTLWRRRQRRRRRMERGRRAARAPRAPPGRRCSDRTPLAWRHRRRR